MITISDGAEIILISLIINALITYAAVEIFLRRMNLKPFIRMGKQFAHQMGLKSQQVQHENKNRELAKTAKSKVTHAAIEVLPGGGLLKKILEKANVSPEEIFALMQDQNFIKGIQVIMETFGGLVEKVTGTGKEESKTDQGLQFSQ